MVVEQKRPKSVPACRVLLTVKFILRSFCAIFDNLVSQKGLCLRRKGPKFGPREEVLSVYRVLLAFKGLGHSEVIQCISKFEHIASRKRLVLERNGPGPIFGSRGQYLVYTG